MKGNGVLFSAVHRGDAGVARPWRVERAVLVTSDDALQEVRRSLETPGRLDRLGELRRGLERVPSVGLAPVRCLQDGPTVQCRGDG